MDTIFEAKYSPKSCLLSALRKKNKLYGPFFFMDGIQLPQGYSFNWGSTASRLLRGGSLLFTIQFPEIPGTHFIDLGRMKG